MSDVEPTQPLYSRWPVAFWSSLGIALLIVAGGIWYFAFARNADERALLKVVTRIDEAGSRGFTLPILAPMVIDLQEKYRLAHDNLEESVSEMVGDAVAASTATVQLWAAANTKGCPRYCKNSMMPALRTLELVNDDAEFDNYFSAFPNGDFASNPTARLNFIEQLLIVTGRKIQFARVALSFR